MTNDSLDFFNKLGPESKRLWMTERPGDGQELRILFQTEFVPSKEELKEMAALGCRIQTVADNVLTGKIAVENIPKLAVLNYVVKIEMSRPLFPEKPKSPEEPLF